VEITLIHHIDCGMLTFTDDGFKQQILDDTGLRTGWAAEVFSDLEAVVKQLLQRIRASPFIPAEDKVRGFVYEVESGKLREVG
jgi:carbonic anhydrase